MTSGERMSPSSSIKVFPNIVQSDSNDNDCGADDCMVGDAVDAASGASTAGGFAAFAAGGASTADGNTVFVVLIRLPVIKPVNDAVGILDISTFDRSIPVIRT